VVKNRVTKNTPFITNDAKKSYYQRKNEDKNEDKDDNQYNGPKMNFTNGPPPKSMPGVKQSHVGFPKSSSQQPLFKMEMYQNKAKPEMPIGTYPMPMQLDLGHKSTFNNNTFKLLGMPTEAISYGPNVNIPMQQVYNINLPGPTGDHQKVKHIYEDLLPGKEIKMSKMTLGERLQTYDYIRQILVKSHDGEEISMEGGNNSLLSYIKYMEFNPNHYSPITDNPYSDIPYGMLAYRSCFPIRFDGASQSTVCSKNSIGLNIRIYSLSYAEYYSYTLNQSFFTKYDVWREIAWYEYIRENIIKPKISPNFALLYAYYMSPNKCINFYAMRKGCVTQKDVMTENYRLFTVRHGMAQALTPENSVVRPLGEGLSPGGLPDEIDPSLQIYSGYSMIAVTEASHHNLYQWASKKYEQNGIVKKMLAHGYHDHNVWMGILFQILQGLYVMQTHGLWIRDMTIGDNITIRDINGEGKEKGYWKYVIDGKAYYIPNNGHIVMIDTNFKDITPTAKTLNCDERLYKLHVAHLENEIVDMAVLRKKMYDNYKAIFNTNAFTKEHTANGVVRPPESIMSMIGQMMEDDEINLGVVISKYFRTFMNNRIGTYLKNDLEIPNIRNVTRKYKVGEMAIEVINSETYKWCMINKIKNDGVINIITRENIEDNDYITKDIRVDNLKQYSLSEPIMQNGRELSQEKLLETYIMSGKL
jgi:hypothetical protein